MRIVLTEMFQLVGPDPKLGRGGVLSGSRRDGVKKKEDRFLFMKRMQVFFRNRVTLTPSTETRLPRPTS